MKKAKVPGDHVMHTSWDRGVDYRTVAVYVARRQFQALSTIAWLAAGGIVVIAAWFVFWIVRG